MTKTRRKQSLYTILVSTGTDDRHQGWCLFLFPQGRTAIAVALDFFVSPYASFIAVTFLQLQYPLQSGAALPVVRVLTRTLKIARLIARRSYPNMNESLLNRRCLSDWSSF